jgi:hypothetical protein
MLSKVLVVALSASFVFSAGQRLLGFAKPNIVADGWDKIHSLSDTHHLGWAEDHMIASNDGGAT